MASIVLVDERGFSRPSLAVYHRRNRAIADHAFLALGIARMAYGGLDVIAILPQELFAPQIRPHGWRCALQPPLLNARPALETHSGIATGTFKFVTYVAEARVW